MLLLPEGVFDGSIWSSSWCHEMLMCAWGLCRAIKMSRVTFLARLAYKRYDINVAVADARK